MDPHYRDTGAEVRRAGPKPPRRDIIALRSLVLAWSTALAACSGDQGPDVAPDEGEEDRSVAAVLVQPSSLGLAVPGDTATLHAVAHDELGYPVRSRSIAWSSSDPSVVSVDAAGRLIARALGQVVVSATVDGVVGSVDVEVDPVHSVARNCGPCHLSLPGEHASLLLPLGSCWSCHTLEGEGHAPPQRSHQAASGGFVLLGVHDTVACSACHSDGHGAAAPMPDDPQDCVACHRHDFDQQHGGAGFPTSCPACHAPTLWSDVSFDHEDASGGFALRWAHVSVACTGCHLPETFALRFTPTDEEDCIACHLSLFEQLHADDGYPTTCTSCHDPEGWGDLVYPHRPGSDGFTLLGVHATLTCEACHVTGTLEPRYAPTDAWDCVACHRDAYDATHGGSTFPITCGSCHAPTTWSDVTVDHAAVSGGFVLWGAHTTLACTACHVPVTFEPLYAAADDGDCIACHQADYDAAHAGSGYPTTCLVCHDGATWSGAVFDHDAQYFPIYSGVHQNRWVSGGCPTCHTTPSDFGIFTCFACHRHDREHSDAEHAGVAGYVYDSQACLSCHPDGTA